jgi:hypothetical protein
MLSVANHHAKQSRVTIHPTKTKAVILNKTKNMSRNDLSWSLGDNLIYPTNETTHLGLRDRPFNLQGGGYGFLFRSELFFSDNTRVRILLFFVAQSANFFPEFNQVKWSFPNFINKKKCTPISFLCYIYIL